VKACTAWLRAIAANAIPTTMTTARFDRLRSNGPPSPKSSFIDLPLLPISGS
jgi:hypothetical protein